ncbi:MAG: DUF6298 domain-containing protein [Niabella sp.]
MMLSVKQIFYFLFFIFYFSQTISAQKNKPEPVFPIAVKNGKLVYNADSITGDRVPDFSYCGYKASEQKIPDVPVKIVVAPLRGDATATIQAAIDYVAGLQPDKAGFRGAVLLQKGTFEIGGNLFIKKSGIVLRGSGFKGETVLLGKGIDRDGMIQIKGIADRKLQPSIEISDNYVPVNAITITLKSTAGLKIGDQIIITRPSTWEWIDALGTRSFGGGISALGWKPGEVDIEFDRTITSVNGNKISIDVPLTTSIDAKYGGGTIANYTWPGRIDNIGIENITMVSDYNKKNLKDEYHRWMAIVLENVQDTWVRQVSFKHFAGSAVHILSSVKRITVEDCISTEPISEIGGQRRYTFFTRGQQTLFQRCYAVNGYHDFSVGHCAPGPNAFVQCVSNRPYSFSGAIDKWANGVLFDVMKVDGNAIRLGNRGQDGQGAGWAAANSLLWNSTAALIECAKPPTAQNYAIGSWSQFAGDGFWNESNNWVTPRSLYYAQLEERVNTDVSQLAQLLPMETEATSSPSVELAQELTNMASKPRMQMDEWIAKASERNPISTNSKGAAQQKIITNGGWTALPSGGISINDGRIVYNDDHSVVAGKRQEVPWWSGGVEGKDLENAKRKLALTRFVPGRVGAGLTDDLEAVVDSMKKNNVVGVEQHYALWYERRRDDHERIRRMDGEVWPPFYELPFARTGVDTAWDGLSKYDLTKYNLWYWSRLQEFATLATANGLVLIHENYFQHNIIEAGAHYADFPWRTANNINNTGFEEPVNYAGDKRIFYAEQFYDITNPVRKELHKKYIWKGLENFQFNQSVIQSISEEYTGPLHFVQFWLDCIASWISYKRQNPLVSLSTTKDVQDAILNDSKYTSVVDIIDIKYWHYQADGSVYAPEGGKNLAPRQWARLLKPKPTSFEQVYRAVREYRDKYPEKAVMYSGDSYDRYGWAVLMAGGSLPVLPANTDKDFLKAAAQMAPDGDINKYMLKGKFGMIIYNRGSNVNISDNIYMKKKLIVKIIDAATGQIQSVTKNIKAADFNKIKFPAKDCLLWISWVD